MWRRVALCAAVLLLGTGIGLVLFFPDCVLRPVSRFEGKTPGQRLALLEQLARSPDPRAVPDLLALDEELLAIDTGDQARAGERAALGNGLFAALLATAQVDDAALRALVARADRRGVARALLATDDRAVHALLDAVAAGDLDAYHLRPHIEVVSDPAAFPRLGKLALDERADALLRDRALALLTARGAAPGDGELLALVEAHRERPFDRGTEQVARRAALALAARDPDRHSELRREFEDRRRNRYGENGERR